MSLRGESFVIQNLKCYDVGRMSGGAPDREGRFLGLVPQTFHDLTPGYTHQPHLSAHRIECARHA